MHPKWLGKCPDCGAWDSLASHTVHATSPSDPATGAALALSDPSIPLLHSAAVALFPRSEPVATTETDPPRLATGISELDRALGGGLVPGSAVLVGGPPGIGKSTLMLQAAGAIARAGTSVLYVSSEESVAQIRMRADRLGLLTPTATEPGTLSVLADSNLPRIFEQVRTLAPRVLVLDSLQLVSRPDTPGLPGSPTQLRRCCTELVFLAKASGIPVVMVGHVTKEGALAGPRLIEHLVDVVLAFEGDRHHAHRVVRAVKNRFGNTAELGIFEMTSSGLRDAPDPAALTMAASRDGSRPGGVLCPVLAGARCLLVEIQALTATGFLGAARRKCSGLDPNRLAMLIAVLEQHAEFRLADRDVFASSTSGIRALEPAADLAILLAIAGAHLRRGMAAGVAAVGEVSLAGQVVPVPALDQRIRHAGRLGCSRVIVPKSAEASAPPGVTLERVADVHRAIEMLG